MDQPTSDTHTSQPDHANPPVEAAETAQVETAAAPALPHAHDDHPEPTQASIAAPPSTVELAHPTEATKVLDDLSSLSIADQRALPHIADDNVTATENAPDQASIDTTSAATPENPNGPIASSASALQFGGVEDIRVACGFSMYAEGPAIKQGDEEELVTEDMQVSPTGVVDSETPTAGEVANAASATSLTDEPTSGMDHHDEKAGIASEAKTQEPPVTAVTASSITEESVQPQHAIAEDRVIQEAAADPTSHPSKTSPSPPSNIIAAWDRAMDIHEKDPHAVVRLNLGELTSLGNVNTIELIVMPPGTRLQAPQAHSKNDVLITCISGNGLVWQNGYTYPFLQNDSGGWKAGTATPFTILNDAGPGSDDLVLLMAQERHENNLVYLPMLPDRNPRIPRWRESDMPKRSTLGPHPGVVGIGYDGREIDVPNPKQGPRPSNIVNAPEMLDGTGVGDMYCEATSLSHDTGLSGRIGINFEIGPPGTRSSDAHAHSFEDELIFVLGGQGLVWINGYTYPVTVGDAIGFPSGTGDAHVFINDSNADTGDELAAGEDLVLWIFGENRRAKGDRIYYPLALYREEDPAFAERWWTGES